MSESRTHVEFSFPTLGKNTLNFKTKARSLFLKEKTQRLSTLLLQMRINRNEPNIDNLTVYFVLKLFCPCQSHLALTEREVGKPLISEHVNCGQHLFCHLKVHCLWTRSLSRQCVQVPRNLLPLSPPSCPGEEAHSPATQVTDSNASLCSERGIDGWMVGWKAWGLSTEPSQCSTISKGVSQNCPPPDRPR